MFNASCEPRYILNELYIKDYIIFMQKCSKDKLKSVISHVEEVKIVEKDVNLNISQIIVDVITAERNQKILKKMSNLNIKEEDDDTRLVLFYIINSTMIHRVIQRNGTVRLLLKIEKNTKRKSCKKTEGNLMLRVQNIF